MAMLPRRRPYFGRAMASRCARTFISRGTRRAPPRDAGHFFRFFRVTTYSDMRAAYAV